MQSPVVRNLLLSALVIFSGCELGYEQPSAPSSGASRSQERTAIARVARGHLEFVEGYAQGCSLAARQRKPVMLFFTAHWCSFCRQMADEAFTHPQVVRLSGQFVCVLVDADVEPEVCRQYEVSGYPTIQFLSPRGVPLERVVGKKPGQQVMMAMQAALEHVARRLDAPEPLGR
jgi:thiol:disulfide interchange protein